VFENSKYPNTLYYPIDGHWNKNGHILAADAITDFIITNPELVLGMDMMNDR
jgi:hypothetical protein